MDTQIQNILDSFDHLPESSKQEVATEILRRTVRAELPELSEQEVEFSIERFFDELDRAEAETAIRRSMEQFARGEFRPAREALEELRQKHGISG
ncbi:MAG TPA: hypothetical protein VNQ79_19445 [Blastocatellia bacterium]|nr:hypothetical protein [Blastocatellia bacterium]